MRRLSIVQVPNFSEMSTAAFQRLCDRVASLHPGSQCPGVRAYRAPWLTCASEDACSQCVPAHHALMRLLGTDEARAKTLLQRSRDRASVMAERCGRYTELPETADDVIDAVCARIEAFCCSTDCTGKCHTCDGCCDEVKLRARAQAPRGVTGICWGMIAPFPVVTLAPDLNGYVAWSDVEYGVRLLDDSSVCPVSPVSPNSPDSPDSPNSPPLPPPHFRPIDLSELTEARAMDVAPPDLDDTRRFFGLRIVPLIVQGRQVVHELVVAAGGAAGGAAGSAAGSAADSGFFGVLAPDADGGRHFLFAARSLASPPPPDERTGVAPWRTDLQASHALPQSAKTIPCYLMHLCHLVHRARDPCSTPSALEGWAQAYELTRDYVTSAARVWRSERANLLLEELMIRRASDSRSDYARAERVAASLSKLNDASLVFTGNVWSCGLTDEDALRELAACDDAELIRAADLVVSVLAGELAAERVRRLEEEVASTRRDARLVHALLARE